jgi:cobaltochelatase CobT
MIADKDQTEIFKDATAAALRALSARRGVEITFSSAENADRKLHLTQKNRARLPVPAPVINDTERALLRGAADAEALRIKYHNTDLHATLRSGDERARLIFDAMEQARVEALGATNMTGVGKNLAAVLGAKSTRLGYHTLKERHNDTLPDALHAYLRQRLTGEALSPASQQLVATWQDVFNTQITPDDITTLQKNLSDQKNFAHYSNRLLVKLDILSEDSKPSEQATDTPQDEQQKIQQPSENNTPKEDEKETSSDSGWDEAEGEEDQASDNQLSAEVPQDDTSSTIPSDEDEAQEQQAARSDNNKIADGPGTSYHIYTKAYDEVVRAEELADDDELYRLRATLDKQMSHLQPLIGKLANRLQRKLMARQTRSWVFDLEEGYLDSSRLARVVANPTVPLSFKQEKETDFKDTIVTLLLDNSGSMRGRPITIAAMCADILARTLERCNVKVEILGFTTRAWKGGKARDIWIQNGRPQNPGRLNDLRHIIYKNADAPMRRARRNLGLMLKEGLLKENIDGEALVWAYNRLAPRAEQRKILMVISDGAPVDDSTLSVNPSHILEHDLRHVITWIEMVGKVQLAAIGIGHDVTRYYKRALTIRDADALAEALIDNLSALFDRD